MCFIYDKYADEPFHLCPRHKLADFLTECELSHEKKFLTDFEIEFVLLDSSGNALQTNDNINACPRQVDYVGTH